MSGFFSRSVATIGMCLLAVMVSGCNSIPGVGGPASTKASNGLKEMHDDFVAPAMNELESTRSLLDRLATTSDLPGWFKEYNATVAKMQSAAARARDRWAHLTANGQAYIDHWDKEIATMQTSDVKESVEARRARVVASFEKIKAEAAAVRDAYDPYLQSLLDIQKALKVDLTAGGVAALKPSVEKAKTAGTGVAKKVDELGTEMDRLAGRLAPKT